MKKLLSILLFSLAFIVVKAQRNFIPNTTPTNFKKVAGDSVLLYPTGCGNPANLTGVDSLKKMGAIYIDSCAHRLWVYDPKLKAWDSVHLGPGGTGGIGGPSFDSSYMNARILLKFNTADTAILHAQIIDRFKYIDSVTKVATPTQIKDSIKNLVDYLTLNNVTDFSTFNKYAKTVYVKDTIRGGTFNVYTGTDAADNGMIFTDGLGQKWLRQTTSENDKINILWYGARQNSTDCRSKFIDALHYIYGHPRFRTLYVPYDSVGSVGTNVYYLSDSILIDRSISILGDGTINNPASYIYFPAHTTGFVFKFQYGEAGIYPSIKNIRIRCGTDGTYNTSKHAITTNNVIDIQNVVVDNYDGDGLHISACGNVPSGDNNNYGNADRAMIINFSAFFCNNGVFVEGCDANAIAFINLNVSQNRRWGAFDNGFLGNTYSHPHMAFDGVPAISGANSVVLYSGKYYTAKPGFDGYWGDAADSNFNKQPDINPIYWYEVTAMSNTVWNSTTRYYSGGPLCVKNENAWTQIYSPYTEGSQPPIYLNPRSVVYGGDNGADVKNGIFHYSLYGEEWLRNGGFMVQKYLHVGTLTFDPSAQMKIYNDNAISGSFVGLKVEGTAASIYNEFKGSSATALHGVGGTDYFVSIGGQIIHRTSTSGLRPDVDTVFNMGESTSRWKNIYGKRFYGDALNLTNVIHPADTAAAWLTKITRSADSVFYWIGGSRIFAFKDSTGGGGSMVYPGAGIALSTGSAWGTSITDNSANWNTVLNRLLIANNLSDLANAGTARTNLGATTVGSNLFTLTNPSAVTFPRINADNTVSTLSAASMLSAIGAQATFTSQTANTFYAAPNGSAGVPSFRTIAAADIPTLNQSTTGSAGSVTNTLSIAAELIAGGATTYNGSAAKSIAIQPTSVTNAMLAGNIDLSTKVTGVLPTTSHPALTGDVTNTSGTVSTTIANNAVTNAKAAQMAAHTFKGNNTGSTANASDLTATQLTAELNAMVGDAGSGGTKGLVPAPSAGDAAASKFLKADGTWAVPPGGGGSSYTASFPVTLTGLDFGLDTIHPVTGVLTRGEDKRKRDSTAAADAFQFRGTTTDVRPFKYVGDNIVTHKGFRAGRNVEIDSTSAGDSIIVFNAINDFDQQVCYADAGGGTTITAVGAAITATGTGTAVSVGTSNNYSNKTRLEYLVTTASTTAVAGWRQATTKFFFGNTAGQGGFTYTCYFGNATGAATTTNRCFVGMQSSTAAPTDVQPSSLINMFGVGWDAADGNLQFFNNDASGTATKTDLGGSFPVPTTDRSIGYKLYMYSAPNSSVVSYTVTDLNSGTSVSGSVSSDLPANTLFLGGRGYMSVGGTSSVIGIALIKMSIKSKM